MKSLSLRFHRKLRNVQDYSFRLNPNILHLDPTVGCYCSNLSETWQKGIALCNKSLISTAFSALSGRTRPLINTFLDINPRGAVSLYLLHKRDYPQYKTVPLCPIRDADYPTVSNISFLYPPGNVENAPVERRHTVVLFASHRIASPRAIVMRSAIWRPAYRCELGHRWVYLRQKISGRKKRGKSGKYDAKRYRKTANIDFGPASLLSCRARKYIFQKINRPMCSLYTEANIQNNERNKKRFNVEELGGTNFFLCIKRVRENFSGETVLLISKNV